MPTPDLGQRLVQAYRVSVIPSPETEDAIVARLVNEPAVVPQVRRTCVVSAAVIALAIAATLILILRGVRSLTATPDHEPTSPLQQAPNHSQPGPACERSAKDCVAVSRAKAVSSSPQPSEIPDTSHAPPLATTRADPKPETPPPVGVGKPSRAVPSAHVPPIQQDVPKNAPEKPPSTLVREAKLLARAQAALRDGAHDRALQALGDHAAAFPDGAMQMERRALRAVSLCLMGRIHEGKAVARRLVTPGSVVPYSARIASACNAVPSR